MAAFLVHEPRQISSFLLAASAHQQQPGTIRRNKHKLRDAMHLTTTALLRAAESQDAQSTCQTAGRRPPGGRVGGQAADVVHVPMADEGAALQGGPVGAPPQVEGQLPGAKGNEGSVVLPMRTACKATFASCPEVDARAVPQGGAVCPTCRHIS